LHNDTWLVLQHEQSHSNQYAYIICVLYCVEQMGSVDASVSYKGDIRFESCLGY